MKHMLFLIVILFSLESATLFAQESAAPVPASAPQTIESQQQQRTISAAELFALMAGEAEKGSSQAMLTMGNLYERGIGAPRHFGKALEWYTKAANANMAEGYYNMGACYEIGMGTAVDSSRAVANYEKASGMGLAIASMKLAELHFAGSLVSKDDSKAFSYLTSAANAGHAAAANQMGVILLDGLLGQAKDEKQAFAMFTKAADLGNLEAIKNIAVIYKDGLGQEASLEKALMWYTVVQKGGYQGDLTPVMESLKSDLDKAQIQKAETEADAWLAEFSKRTGARQ